MIQRAHAWLVTCGCAAGIALFACSGDGLGPRAAAYRMGNLDHAIGGPKAIGTIGDYVLENDRVRVIVHGPGPNRGSMIFSGSIIDADLVRPLGDRGRGRDQLGDVSPTFVFEAFDPVSFAITRDGSDGGPAELTIEGEGGELLQMVAAVNTGVLFPPGLTFRVQYRLAPGKSYVEIETTLINSSGAVHPFPFLDPPDLIDLGLDIPGIDQLSFSVPLGNILLFGAANAIFAPGPTGFNVRFALEDTYADPPGLPAFPGLVVPFLATRGEGVSYGMTALPGASNYVESFPDAYPNAAPGSMLLPFTFSGITAAYHTNPPDSLAANETFSYSSFLMIGNGDVASVAESYYDLHGIATGVLAGRVFDARTLAGESDASVIVQEPGGDYVTQMNVDEDGTFRGAVPPGNYVYRVVTNVRDTTEPKPIEIRAGQTTSILELLEAPAHLEVAAWADGRAAPAKLTLVGNFPGEKRGDDPRTFLYDLAAGERRRFTAFDADSTEFIEASTYAADGAFALDVRPGTYDLVVSRGPEYEVHRETITLEAASFESRTVHLTRSLDTSGYVAADLHLHSGNSADSPLSLVDRVVSAAGEGLEYAAATDHNFVTDYKPAIAAAGLIDWLESSVGLELTTFEMGHFNAFPLDFDRGSIRGGDIVWAGETPDSLFAQMRDLGRAGPERTIVQVNHPRADILGYFNAFHVDQDTAAPLLPDGLRSVFAPIGPEFALDNFSLDFDTIEIVNGKRLDITHTFRVPEQLPPGTPTDNLPEAGEILREEDGRIAFPGVVEDWFQLMNRGHAFTGTANSDSHATIGQEPGYPRTLIFVGAGRDDVGAFSEQNVVDGLKNGRAIMTNGPMVSIRIGDGTIGDTVSGSGSVELDIVVTAVSWIPFDTVTVWRNGVAVETFDTAGQTHFASTVSVPVPEDSWIAVEVTGTASMFPIAAPTEFASLSATAIIDALSSSLDLSGLAPFGDLAPAQSYRVTPFALTNPIWVDTDGNGAFDPVAGTAGTGAAADTAESPAPSPHQPRLPQPLEDQFDALPEIAP